MAEQDYKEWDFAKVLAYFFYTTVGLKPKWNEVFTQNVIELWNSSLQEIQFFNQINPQNIKQICGRSLSKEETSVSCLPNSYILP